MNMFEGWQSFDAEGATVPFYKKSEGGVSYIGFDSRPCVPPEPMVNAMVALKFADKNTKIIMVNHKYPVGLIPKIESNFNIERENLDGEQVRLTFSLKDGASLDGFNFDKTCH